MKSVCVLFGLLLSTIFNVGRSESLTINKPSLVILGTVQDAGSPHPACEKECCKDLFKRPDDERMVVSLGIVDPWDKSTLLFEATPDLPKQMNYLQAFAPYIESETPNGIFISHAHIGHYTGLMYLGREAMNAQKVPVFVMPKMREFIENNGPWDQLLKLNNIVLYDLVNNEAQNYTENIKIKPFLVPHRDEYSETVGFLIQGPSKNALFIPDIDKWTKWDVDIIQYLSKIDYAFLDATFFDGNEVNNRDIKEIPHPFVIESMELFKHLPANEKAKVHFIHLNHTNPLLDKESKEYKTVISAGFNVAQQHQIFEL